MFVYRIGSSRYPANDGNGAALYGGRWNHKGTPLIYAAESRALPETSPSGWRKRTSNLRASRRKKRDCRTKLISSPCCMKRWRNASGAGKLALDGHAGNARRPRTRRTPDEGLVEGYKNRTRRPATQVQRVGELN